MAKSKKQQPGSGDGVVRIKASSSPASKRTKVSKPAKTEAVETAKKAIKATKVKKPGKQKGWTKPFRAIGGYFKGAWFELRQVRWPTRSATWGLTVAVLLYSAFFVVVILLLDAAFKYMFELILGN